MKDVTIKSQAQAEQHILNAIAAETEKANALFEELYPFNPSAIIDAQRKLDNLIDRASNGEPEALSEFTERDSKLVILAQTNEFIERLNDTLQQDLIVVNESHIARAKAKRLQREGKLVSPPGFHPATGVFVEVA